MKVHILNYLKTFFFFFFIVAAPKTAAQTRPICW